MSEEKHPEHRILLAFGLVFLLLMVWPVFMGLVNPQPPQPEQPPAAEGPTTEQKSEAAPEQTSSMTSATAPPEGFEPERKALDVAGFVVKQGTYEQTIEVESGVATVTFSTRGGTVRSWTLKDHKDDDGNPLELVHGGDTGLGFPLELGLDDPELEAALNQTLFVSNLGNLEFAAVSAPAEVVLEWSGVVGGKTVAAKKSIAFPDGYEVEVETEVWVDGAPQPHRVKWSGGFGDLHSPAAGFVPNVLLRDPESLRRVGVEAATRNTGWIFKSDPQLETFTGPAAYAGLEDRYFTVIFIPDTPALTLHVEAGEWIPNETHNGSSNNSAVPQTGDEKEEEESSGKPQLLGSIAVGVAGAAENRFRVFVGPKALEILEAIEVAPMPGGTTVELADELVDFGWFWWVARPLLVAMRWIHANLVSNYGWAIILLTFVINLVMFPLKYKSSRSAWKMQRVAPQVKALQEKSKKYKATDPKRSEVQQEIMALYKTEGVNPMGGCLPLLIQFPFFLGFYRLLYNTIELRQAPWIGWVHDLSQPDPFYILPVVMTATMWLSTQMTPMTTADPAQQRMMKMMPLIFGIMFLTFPSGLVLYWFTSNLVGIGQQWWINKRHQEFEEAEKAAAKKKKKKKKRN